MTSYIDEVEHRLQYFRSPRPVRLWPQAPQEAITKAETRLDCGFSPEYRHFLKSHNGGRIVEVHLLGVQLLSVKRIPRDLDLTDINLSLREYEWWPKNWLQLGVDGFGDLLVADLSRRDDLSGEYPILRAYHADIGAPNMVAEFASGYFNMLDKVIDEMISLYTPEGHLKSG